MRLTPIVVLALIASAVVTGTARAQLAVAYQQTPTSPLLSGPFANVNSAASVQRVADDFTLASPQSLAELDWWGFMYSSPLNQQVGLGNLSGFLVQVFRDDGLTILNQPGAPGTPVHAETIPMAMVTSTLFGTGSFNGPTYLFHAALSSPVSLAAGHYWVAINAVLINGSASSALFTWMDQGSASQQFAVDGLLSDPVDGVWRYVSGSGKGFRLYAVADSDGDGLSDTDEAIHGTNPADPDTDADGLLDGTEVDLAGSGSCLDPLDADSDGDLLLDGDEVDWGYDPCAQDTDGDGLNDAIDPEPLVNAVSMDQLASVARAIADQLSAVDVGQFDAPNANAAAGRRNSLATRVQNAAKALESGNTPSALALLGSVRERIDGDPDPADWLNDGADQDLLLIYVDELIAVIGG